MKTILLVLFTLTLGACSSESAMRWQQGWNQGQARWAAQQSQASNDTHNQYCTSQGGGYQTCHDQ